MRRSPCSSFFFFNDTATTEIYTLSLHDALPISEAVGGEALKVPVVADRTIRRGKHRSEEHTSELQSQSNLVCRLLLEKKNTTNSWFDGPRTTSRVLCVCPLASTPSRASTIASTY